MIYPDASILVAATLVEEMTEASRALLSGADELAGSEWLVTEVASALAIKERSGAIRLPTRIKGVAACRELLANSMTLLTVTGADCLRAAEYVERSALRAPDALHLAVAARGGAIVWTLDRRMTEAGQALGLNVRLLA